MAYFYYYLMSFVKTNPPIQHVNVPAIPATMNPIPNPEVKYGITSETSETCPAALRTSARNLT